MASVNRRDFFKFVGAGGVGAGAGYLYAELVKRPQELLIPQVIPPEDYSPGLATWYNTVCNQCSGGCGISVRVREGEAKKIEGNPVHPINQGRLCALGQSGLNALYNPDRLKTPLRNNSEGKFQGIEWKEAIDELAQKLGESSARGQNDRVQLLTGNIRGHVNELIGHFMEWVGVAHHMQYDFTRPASLYEANQLTFDQSVLPYYDIRNTQYLLSFGADYLGTWLSPIHNSLGYGHLRQGQPEKRGTCIQGESRMSLSGANADEWLPAVPGSEGSLALGIANVITNRHYTGADQAEWANALTAHTPSNVARLTGISEADIERVAEEFFNSNASLAIAGGAATAGTEGVATHIAVNALNYLAGNVGQRGGVIFNSDSGFVQTSTFEHASYQQMITLIEKMRNNQVDVLILHDTNPIFSMPSNSSFKEAMENVPLVVALSSFMDETTAMADLILPTDNYLEAWGDDVPEPGVGFSVASISQPTVSRLYDTRSLGDILIDTAKTMGIEVNWDSTKAYIQDVWSRIYVQQGGDPSGFDDFWRSALEAGVWGQEPASTDQELTVKPFPIDQLTDVSNKLEGDESEYPFVLHPYLTLTFLDGRGANLPWQQELPDPLTSVVYNSWIELNPSTAARLDVKEGDVLEVTSPSGTTRVPAFIYEAIRPDVVAMPIGQGHEQYGRYAKQRGVNPIDLVVPNFDQRSGALAWAGTRVKILKTGERVMLIKTDGITRTLGRQILGPSEAEHS